MVVVGGGAPPKQQETKATPELQEELGQGTSPGQADLACDLPPPILWALALQCSSRTLFTLGPNGPEDCFRSTQR